MGKDPRAVSPVVSVVLTVAITILLAAVVSVFVLSLGDGTSEEGPSVSFSVEQEGDRVIVTHAAGDTINTSDLRLTGVKGWGPSGQEFSAGDRINGTPKPGAERVDIVFETPDSSSVLRTIDVSGIEVTSLVVNDGFERGTGDDADSWERSTTGAGAVRTSEESLSGEYSMKQVDLVGSYSSRRITSATIEVTGGQEYEFGGSYYLSDPGAGASPGEYRRAIRVEWFNSQGNELASESADEFGDLTKFEQWEEIRESATAPSEAVTARVVFDAQDHDDVGPTDIYWDETFIEQAG